MMGYTDKHARYFLRLIAPSVRLYTEMITTQSLLHGDAKRLLSFHPAEKYLALQLGGCNPKELTDSAKMGEEWGYDEINLNVGCPSSRVCAARFGASLMLDPHLVADCIATMQAEIKIPVTIKCRIGVDDYDDIELLQNFVQLSAQAGCKTFIIHARKAWLSGLSPKQNRDIPPLRYDMVYKIKHAFPKLSIIINGGLNTLPKIDEQLSVVDGIMIGRTAYSHPYLLSDLQTKYFGHENKLSRFEILNEFILYIREQLQDNVKLANMTRHVLGLFYGERGASRWRRYLSEHAHLPGAGVEVIEKAMQMVISD